MIELTDTDFQPLEQFRLKWRWTDPKWNQLPEDALSQIRPLTKEKAQEFWQRNHGYIDASGLSDKMFESVLRFDARWEIQKVCDWLLQQVSDRGLLVIASWESGVAVLVSWDVFCDYWNDFCYPSGDDVLVWPLSGEWAMFWYHEEMFFFGRRRVNASRDGI